MTKTKSYRMKEITLMKMEWLGNAMKLNQTQVLEIAIARWYNEIKDAPELYELIVKDGKRIGSLE